jgi:hypothetical protein
LLSKFSKRLQVSDIFSARSSIYIAFSLDYALALFHGLVNFLQKLSTFFLSSSALILGWMHIFYLDERQRAKNLELK